MTKLGSAYGLGLRLARGGVAPMHHDGLHAHMHLAFKPWLYTASASPARAKLLLRRL